MKRFFSKILYFKLKIARMIHWNLEEGRLLQLNGSRKGRK
jgi:hypothetical protein